MPKRVRMLAEIVGEKCTGCRLCEQRTTTITWYYNDGTECGDTKVVEKPYSSFQGMKAVKRRFDNILTSVQINVIGYIMIANGVSQADAIADAQIFEEIFDTDMGKYLKGTATPLIIKMATHVFNTGEHTWIDIEHIAFGPSSNTGQTYNTPRELLVAELTP